MRKVIVLGSGTAGIVTATILKKYLDLDISIIYSEAIGIVGVGEGTTEHIHEYMEFMGFSESELLEECGAVKKAGVLFKNWSIKSPEFLYSINTANTKGVGQYPYIYASMVANGIPSNRKEDFSTGKIANTNEAYQYHFDSYKLNEYLIKKAKQLGISFIQDTIIDTLVENNEIQYLLGESEAKYTADFYIDSTGFKKTLISKLGGEWLSHSKYLKMNAAIVASTPAVDNPPLWTEITALKYGWMFSLFTQEHTGRGYVFDSSYVTKEQAKEEMQEILGTDISIGKSFSFDPGALKEPWIGNCCAIGLSASFIEPLEASAIGTSIQQAFLLMHRLPNYTEETIQAYNKSVRSITNNIRDFIALHYISDRRDTPFWRDVANLDLPPSLNSKLKLWSSKLPIKEDFFGESNYILFGPYHFLEYMYGVEMLNKGEVTKELDNYNNIVKHSGIQQLKGG